MTRYAHTVQYIIHKLYYMIHVILHVHYVIRYSHRAESIIFCYKYTVVHNITEPHNIAYCIP